MSTGTLNSFCYAIASQIIKITQSTSEQHSAIFLGHSSPSCFEPKPTRSIYCTGTLGIVRSIGILNHRYCTLAAQVGGVKITLGPILNMVIRSHAHNVMGVAAFSPLSFACLSCTAVKLYIQDFKISRFGGSPEKIQAEKIKLDG